ncbi:hypothetical protein D3C73_598770 [compost metagenome]
MMNPIHQENKQLQQYLNDKLDELPLLEPPQGFTDKVMQAISSTDSIPTSRYMNSGSTKWKQNIIHGIIASAATVLLVSTGTLHRLVTINDQMVEFSAYIEKLSLYLVS